LLNKDQDLHWYASISHIFYNQTKQPSGADLGQSLGPRSIDFPCSGCVDPTYLEWSPIDSSNKRKCSWEGTCVHLNAAVIWVQGNLRVFHPPHRTPFWFTALKACSSWVLFHAPLPKRRNNPKQTISKGQLKEGTRCGSKRATSFFTLQTVTTTLPVPTLSLWRVTLLCVVLGWVQLFATPWTVARQAPLSVGFPRQEYWSGLPFPPPGDLPYPGIESKSPASPALAGGFFTTEPPGKPKVTLTPIKYSSWNKIDEVKACRSSKTKACKILNKTLNLLELPFLATRWRSGTSPGGDLECSSSSKIYALRSYKKKQGNPSGQRCHDASRASLGPFGAPPDAAPRHTDAPFSTTPSSFGILAYR